MLYFVFASLLGMLLGKELFSAYLWLGVNIWLQVLLAPLLTSCWVIAMVAFSEEFRAECWGLLC